jgi:hypothetical protein
VRPLRYRLVDETVVIRTGRGTRLDIATRDSVVAFEVDDFDPGTARGWCVVVTGVAREVPAPVGGPTIEPPLPRWPPSEHGRIVAISTELLAGWTLRPMPVG